MRVFGLVKSFKDPRLNVWGNADPGVLYGKSNAC